MYYAMGREETGWKRWTEFSLKRGGFKNLDPAKRLADKHQGFVTENNVVVYVAPKRGK
jgi:hypothetical protein